MKYKSGQQYAAFILLLILCLSGLFAYLSLQDGHDWGGDFALYLRQAQSILDGTSQDVLAQNSYAMDQSTQQEGANPQVGPHLYPWGFPLLLAPVVALFGFSLTAVKVYVIIFFLLSLLVSYRLFLPRIGPVYSLWLVAVLGFNPFLLKFSDTINSDIPFLFFALLSILFIEKTLGYRKLFINRTLTCLLTGVLIYFSFLVRTNGIVLVGVLGIGHLIKWYHPLRERFAATFKKEWKELLPYVGFAACWILLKLWLPGGSGSHLAFLKRITPGKLAYNIMYYIELPAEFYEGVLFPYLIYGITIPFLLLGIYKRIRRMPDILYLVYSAASLVIFILWPPIQGLRFIFSLLPFYIYYTFVGLSAAEIVARPEVKRVKISWVPVFSMVLLVLFFFRSMVYIYEVHESYPEKQISEGPYTPQSREMFRYLETHTEPDDIIIFFKPRVMTFISKRQSLRVTRLAEIREGKGNILVFNKLVNFGQIPAEEFNELKLELPPVFVNEQFEVLNLDNLPRLMPAASR